MCAYDIFASLAFSEAKEKTSNAFFLSAFTSVLTFVSSHRAYSKSSCVVDAVMRRAGGGVLLSLFSNELFLFNFKIY